MDNVRVHTSHVRMRDGTQLHADIYLPSRMADPSPALLHLTPYDDRVKFTKSAAKFFSTHDYPFAVVSCRGCGRSEGTPELFAGAGRDGFDTVKWLAGQTWCNGQVAMWGGSYCGFTQWATAAESPRQLVAIAPASACGIVRDYPLTNNIFMCHAAFYCNFVDRNATTVDTIDGRPFAWREVYYKRFVEQRPFASLDSLAGYRSELFQNLIRHSPEDEYWNALLPSDVDYRKIDIPILTTTGHYDGDQRGALMYYNKHREFGTRSAYDQHYIVIGPWNHSGSCVRPRRHLAGLDFGQSSEIDLLDLHIRWYDWVLKGREKPAFLKKRVVYFVEDDNRWDAADDLRRLGTVRSRYHLALQAGQATLSSPGELSLELPSTAEKATFVYDPLDTTPAQYERENETIYHSDGSHVRRFLVDQASVLAHTLHQNGLVYDSRPLASDIEVVGHVRFVVWVSLDVPDTDFQVCVYELTTDQRCIILTDAMLRARYRHSLTLESLVADSRPHRYEFDQFQFFSRRLRQGSRVRLVFRCINSIYWQKNYNSGGPVAHETAQDARTAHVTVYQDPEHVSFVELPIRGHRGNGEAHQTDRRE